MTSLKLALFAVLFAAAAPCQVNPFVFYPQDPERQTITCTSYVGRPDSNNQAEALMEVSTDHFRGVGDANGPVLLFGIYHWIADENLSTSETYDLIVRKSNPNGLGPNMAFTAEYLRISNLSTPPSTNTARGTWITYDGFGNNAPLSILDCCFVPQQGRYYVGVDLAANPLWPTTDGHSLFRADLLSANTPATLGENERLGSPDPTWGGSASFTGLPTPGYSTPWNYILGPLVTSPNLHIGGTDPNSSRLGAAGANYGMNGLFPDITGMPRSDGLSMRITDNLEPDGFVFMGAQLGFQVPYFHWPFLGTLIGHSFIGGPTTLVSIGAARLNQGEATSVIALPNSLPSSLMGTKAVFQAIVWNATISGGTGSANWTNAQVSNL